MSLLARKCVPCEGDVPRLGSGRIGELLKEVDKWEVRDDKLQRTFKFKTFLRAMQFVNRIAEVAEAEGHHPDFSVHYNRVEVVVWTHAIGGLSENDFIVAAKISALLPAPRP